MDRTLPALSRRPAFWFAYVALAAVALVVAWYVFPRALPIVNLDIHVGRGEALDRASALARDRGLAPEDFRAAARFGHDAIAQNYIELEGGGRDAFIGLARGSVYAPYWWDVRMFKPGAIDEATIRLAPDGRAIGFSRRVAETYVRDPATRALDVAAARRIAETGAARDWNVDFARYAPIEQSQETRASGRVDHTFVYERPESFGEARLRLRLSVAGDELTGVAPYVFVPESFGRRFEEMRSANGLIGGLASAAAGLLYGVGGCVIGVLWLLRRHWLVWRPAVVAGLCVGALLAAASLAGAPAAWFGADTTETPVTFWGKQVGSALLVLLGGGLGYAVAFMAAESLSRRAFPAHPQLWRLWSRAAGGSVQVAGRTAGGYLFVPIELALIAGFYYATNRWLGWWQPAEVLSDPNVLSSAVPALGPIALSLQAGFMEECVFRAIPLAAGALLGERFGRRGLGIAVALVVQALVFGGAHATYPGLPAYSRLIELIVPSLIWAAIFLRFGLLPTILLHALFDLTLFSLPIFLVDAPGAWVQQALVVAAAAVPAAIVLLRRARAGAFGELPATLFNGGWQPEPPVAQGDAPATRAGVAVLTPAAIAFQRALPALGLAGLAAWIAFAPTRTDVPPLALGRDAALAIADRAVAERGVRLGDGWRRSSMVKLAPDDPQQQPWHRFVWREAGPDAYRAQVGKVLAPPVWEVRYARFDGDVADRAEEWRVTVADDGGLRTLLHLVPEGRAGARLDGDAARATVEAAIRARLGLDPAKLEPVAAEQDKKPGRLDWTFVYRIPGADVGKDGEARILVALAGDEVVGIGRMVFVPEAWLRAERERDNRISILRIGAGILVVIAGLAAIVLGIVGWTRGRCDTRALWLAGAFAFVVFVGASANSWPVFEMGLRTAEPVSTQITLQLVRWLVGGAFLALVTGLTFGIGAAYARGAPHYPLAGRLPAWGAAIAAGLFVAGLDTALASVVPRLVPSWPALQSLSLWSPLASALTSGLASVGATAVALFVLYVIAVLTGGWTRLTWIGVALVVLLQTVAAVMQGGGNVLAAVASGVTAGLASAAVLFLLLRYDPRNLPAFLATGTALATILHALQLRSVDAYAGAAVQLLAIAAVTVVVVRYLYRPLEPAAA